MTDHFLPKRKIFSLKYIAINSVSGLMIDINSAPDDIFGVVFSAQLSKCPWKSLLVYSVVLRNSLFAELAACFKVNIKY